VVALRLLKPAAVAALVVAVGAWVYVGWERFAEYGTCYDIQGDPDTVQKCDAYAANIATGTVIAFLVSLVALLSVAAALVLPRFGKPQ
jgi:hypothetical protein